MKTKNIIVALLLIAVVLPASAQKAKSIKKAAPATQPVVVEETPAQRLYKAMLPATAKVMFIDSFVVDKSDFIKYIPLTAESGTLTTYTDFFNRKSQVPLGVYQNEFGDRCYYADGDTLGTRLFTLDRLGNQWSKPRELTEFGPDYRNPNYPFLMSDGITLFFSAKGEHSIGGYDIFTTIYDSESGTFYKPENYGLPFNSTANDFLVAFDEINELGYLVSDRFQPTDKVCIYVFEPKFPRQSLESENISDEQLKSLARLTNISSTWRFGNQEKALQRYLALRSESETKVESSSFSFVINDNVIYHKLSDFKSPQSRQQFKQLTEILTELDADRKTLNAQRDKYANASARDQRLMQQSMLRLEHKIMETEAKILPIEKEIRYIENRILSQN